MKYNESIERKKNTKQAIKLIILNYKTLKYNQIIKKTHLKINQKKIFTYYLLLNFIYLYIKHIYQITR